MHMMLAVPAGVPGVIAWAVGAATLHGVAHGAAVLPLAVVVYLVLARSLAARPVLRVVEGGRREGGRAAA
jgi:hypothetical protein